MKYVDTLCLSMSDIFDVNIEESLVDKGVYVFKVVYNPDFGDMASGVILVLAKPCPDRAFPNSTNEYACTNWTQCYPGSYESEHGTPTSGHHTHDEPLRLPLGAESRPESISGRT